MTAVDALQAEGVSADADRIVEAAWRVLRLAGYEGMKVQLVARVAGVSVGTLYRVVGGKEALLAAVYREELERVTCVLTEVTAEGTPTERVRAWVEAIASMAFGSHRARARWFGSLPHDVVRLATQGSGPEIDTTTPLRAAIADGVVDGSFPHADAVIDSQLVGQLCARLSAVESGWSASDPETAVPKVVDFVLGGLTRGVADR